jgi:GNAT superfamily N-acetyltransferase
MWHLAKAGPRELPAVMKLFRRVNLSLLDQGIDMWSHGYPDETDFQSDILKGCLYIAKEQGRLLALVAVSFDPLLAFYPETRNPRKRDALLEECGLREDENVLIIHRLMVDPSFERKGLAKALIRYLESLYPHRLWVFCAYPPNHKAIAFYEKMGFLNRGVHDFEYGDYSKQVLFSGRSAR